MCDNCADRALKLRSIALDFRMTARLGPAEISERLLKTADELEGIADGLTLPGPHRDDLDVVWDTEPTEADTAELAPAV
jgi:hypothetical protein